MTRAAAWGMLATYVVLVVAAVALTVLQGASAGGLGGLGFAGFAFVGTYIALHRPDNAVGWILLVVCLAFTGNEAAQSYVQDPGNPARVAVAWMASGTMFFWFTPAVLFLPLVFPHGRLPSRRWRPVLWLGAVAIALGVVGSALTPGPLELRGVRIENPYGVDGGAPGAAVALSSAMQAAGALLAALSLVSRFRRAHGPERQQVKWFAFVGVLSLLSLTTAVAVDGALGGRPSAWPETVATVAWLTGLALLALGLPAATGIAIFRYRLYDVDAAIRRTLVYGALTVTLGATYVGLVLLIGLAAGESGFAVAAATLAVAALFRPARARIQTSVDQRFYRRRYDAERTLEAFGGRLRDEVDLQALARSLKESVTETVQPVHVSLWLRERRR